MPAAGRLGDKASIQSDAHGCPGCPHPGVGPAIAGSTTVFINGRPALRVDDVGIHAVCCGPNMWSAQQGSPTVFINGKAAFRKDDPSRHCGGSGKLIEGSDNVIIGGATSAASRAGGHGDSGPNTAAAAPAAPSQAAVAAAPPESAASSSRDEATSPTSRASTAVARWSIEDAEGVAVSGVSATFVGSIGAKDFDGSRGQQPGLPLDDAYGLALVGKVDVRGQLQDSDGQPLAHAQLRVERAWGPTMELTTDAQGRFSADGFIRNEPFGLAVLSIRKTVQGKLEDSDGKPVANARLDLERESDAIVSLTTDAQGHFEAVGLAPNESFALTVASTSIVTQARIVDEAGASIVGRRARLRGDGGRDAVTRSDGDGLVQLEGLVPGETYLVDLDPSGDEGKERPDG